MNKYTFNYMIDSLMKDLSYEEFSKKLNGEFDCIDLDELKALVSDDSFERDIFKTYLIYKGFIAKLR